MSADLRISYRPRLDATPEAELEVLATVYSFLMRRHVNRNATVGGDCAELQGGESNQSMAPLGSGGLSTSERRDREDVSGKSSVQREEVMSE